MYNTIYNERVKSFVVFVFQSKGGVPTNREAPT